MQGILEKLRRDARENPNRAVYNFLDCETEPFGQNVVTMGQLHARATDIAADLKRKGAKRGDRAIILSMQDAGTVYAIFGCMLAGVVFTVIPPPIDAGKFARFVSVLKSCGPRFLISNEGMERSSDTKVTAPLLRKAFFQAVALRRVYTDRTERYEGPEIFCGYGADDLVYLQYTSGSTSEPKGVMVSYGNLTACIDQCRELFDFTVGNHNIASWVPFYHNIGLIAALFIPLIPDHGVSYLIPTLQFLAKPTVWLKVLSDFRVNITAAPNSAYDVCTRLIGEEDAKHYDLSHVTHLVNGSEFVNLRTVEKFCGLFHISRNAFAPGYGLSECVCIATLASGEFRSVEIDREGYAKGRFAPVPSGGKAIVGVGRVPSGMRIVAVRADGSPCGPDEIGEICLSGENVCGGYWKNPEETKRFETEIPGHPGRFYRTGDMGALYDGQLYLTGRIKEMIVVSGKNIYPSDITLLLHEQGLAPAVDAVGVFSVESEGGERPVLCAECGGETDFRSLAAEINRAVAGSFGFSFHDTVFVEAGSLPRTDNRKIKTHAIKEAYEAGRLKILYSTRRSGAEQEPPAPRPRAVSADASEEELRAVVRAAFSRAAPGVGFSDEDSFLEIGGDSLQMMELLCGLERDLGISIDLREMAAAPTVAGIAGYLRRVRTGEGPGEKPDLRKECVLDESIRPEAPYTTPPEECRSIFLTGSTGFLGAYLIRSILERRAGSDPVVYCHVRAKDPAAGLERIVANMKDFCCWKEDYRDHIVPVTGDLNLPNLGLDKFTYRRLADEIGLVIHNGALLNFVYPYRQMKRTNVTGTAECLRFACTGRPKYFHYISSYSVYDTPGQFGKTVAEDDPLLSPEGYFLGYSETKWVAEKLVGIARERGLRAAVYRPGDITGTLRDGVWKLEDMISRSIVGCIQMGAVPDIDVNLHLTPVDYVSDAVVAIAFQSGSDGRAYNIINQNLMPMNQVGRLMRRAGYRVETLPYDEWCVRLAACPAEENALRILSCLFTDRRAEGESLVDRFGKRQPRIRTDNADRMLRGTGVSCPPVDAALLKSYLNYFRRCGYIGAPAVRALPVWKR